MAPRWAPRDLPVYGLSVSFGAGRKWHNGEDVDRFCARDSLREKATCGESFPRHRRLRQPGGEVHPLIQAALDRGLEGRLRSWHSFSMPREEVAPPPAFPTTLGAAFRYNTHLSAPPAPPGPAEDAEIIPSGQASSACSCYGSMRALGFSLSRCADGTSNTAKSAVRRNRLQVWHEPRLGDGERTGRFVLRDNEKMNHRRARLLQPEFCLRAGARYDAVAPILPQAVAA